MSMATPQVYVAELERLKFGRPLYNPEHPVNIGDVGFFERDTGNFCPLFNVFHDAADQVNAELGSPNDFVPLSRTHLRITTTNDYFPPQPIKSGSVESKGVELEASANAIIPAGAGITFSCANKLGATLLLRAATTRADVADNRFVHEYILKHIDSWYDYAYQLGYGEVQAPQGSIVLIKGCDKTSSWAHATFAERSREASVFFNGGYFDVGGTVRLQGSWSGAVSAIYREAPLGGRQVHPVRFSATHQHSRIVDTSQVATSNNSPPSTIFPEDCNYSVFARVYRIRRRSVLGMAKLVTVNVDGGTTRHLQHRSPSTSGPSSPGPETVLQNVPSFSPHPSSHQAKSHAAQAALPTSTQYFQTPSLRAASMKDPYLTLSAQTHRPPNTSLSSTVTTSSPEHGSLIRAASSLLCRELDRSRGQLRRNGFSEQEWEETETRMRNLIQLEYMRAWSNTGRQGNVSFVSDAGDEVRQQRAFFEALRDGYVLCQFMNKLRPGSLTNPSTVEDGFVFNSNVTRFLAACSQHGVSAEDLLQRNGFIEASAESLARVARVVLSLFKIMETPTLAERSRILNGEGNSGTQRGLHASSPVTELEPNPAVARSMFSTVKSTRKTQGITPTPVLPTIIDRGLDTFRKKLGPQVTTDHRLLISPPPRSPLRARIISSRRDGISFKLNSLADRGSLGEPRTDSRQWLASLTRTDTTGFSPSMEVQRSTSSGSADHFGTVHTMATNATSIHANDDGSFSASSSEGLGRKQSDLQRVVEETERVATSFSGGKKKEQSNMSSSIELGNTDATDLREATPAASQYFTSPAPASSATTPLVTSFYGPSPYAPAPAPVIVPKMAALNWYGAPAYSPYQNSGFGVGVLEPPKPAPAAPYRPSKANAHDPPVSSTLERKLASRMGSQVPPPVTGPPNSATPYGLPPTGALGTPALSSYGLPPPGFPTTPSYAPYRLPQTSSPPPPMSRLGSVVLSPEPPPPRSIGMTPARSVSVYSSPPVSSSLYSSPSALSYASSHQGTTSPHNPPPPPPGMMSPYVFLSRTSASPYAPRQQLSLVLPLSDAESLPARNTPPPWPQAPPQADPPPSPRPMPGVSPRGTLLSSAVYSLGSEDNGETDEKVLYVKEPATSAYIPPLHMTLDSGPVLQPISSIAPSRRSFSEDILAPSPPTDSTNRINPYAPSTHKRDTRVTSQYIITSPLPVSPRPLPNLLLAMAARKDQGNRVEPSPLTPKRPSHRARHSVDTGDLLPRPPRLRTEFGDASPTRAGLQRSNTHNSAGARPRADRDDISHPREGGRSPHIHLPRSISGMYNLEGSPSQHSPPDVGSSVDRSRVPRGHFTSLKADRASSKHRPRPTSFDVHGSKADRSRFESIVNLGGESSEPIVVKADGKADVQYLLGNYIGRGQFGSVCRGLNLNTGQMVAIKRIQLEDFKEDEVKQLMSEIDLVKSLSHPSIVKYEGMSRDYTTLSIMLEFAESGSLGQTLKAFGKLNERLVASYVVKILDGLLYLHENHVVHRDLKAANILTTKTGNVKLSDFGVSLNLWNLRHMERERKNVAGTLNWMAPEVIKLEGAGYASDIWSLACTVIELLTGRPPYSDVLNYMSVMFRIVEDDMPPFPEGCSELLKDFLCQCFNKDPSKRPSAEALCEHEWLKFTWVAGQERRQQDSIPDLRRVGPAGLLDAAEFLELKTQKQYSTLNSEEESWDDEPSIMVDPNLQLGGHILDDVLDYILKKVPGADVVIATDEDLFTLCPGPMLPSDIADMLNNLQPPCHASAAFGGKTLATLKDFMNSTMVSSHSSQDHFKADVKPLSNRVHSFFPSVREGNQDEHDGDDNDMGRGNSKSKSRDAKSSADAKVSPQVAVRYITTPAGKKKEIQAHAPKVDLSFGRGFKRGLPTTPVPVKTSFREQPGLYYDKELKKSVSKTAGGNATKTASSPPEARSVLVGAPPPLQPAPVTHDGPSPSVTSALSSGTPHVRKGMAYLSRLPLLALPPAPGRPNLQTAKRDVRSHSMDVFKVESDDSPLQLPDQYR